MARLEHPTHIRCGGVIGVCPKAHVAPSSRHVTHTSVRGLARPAYRPRESPDISGNRLNRDLGLFSSRALRFGFSWHERTVPTVVLRADSVGELHSKDSAF